MFNDPAAALVLALVCTVVIAFLTARILFRA